MRYFASFAPLRNALHRLALPIGIGLPFLLWFTLRQRYLGIQADAIRFAAHETLDERLFTYIVFGMGMVAAALVARNGHRWYLAPLTGGSGYMSLVVSLQNLWINPDLWKFWERGYATRLVEIVVIGAVIGLCLTNYRSKEGQPASRPAVE
jgi:hypothetical protein